VKIKPKPAAMRRYTVVLPDNLFERIRREAFKSRETVAETTRRLMEKGLEVA
jgi:hypothetical protein